MINGIWQFENPGGFLIDTHRLNRILSLLLRVEQRDLHLALHCHRVASLSTRLAQFLDLPASSVHNIRWAALLHDVGKMVIPEAILNEQAPLNQEEWSIVHRHPADGAEMVRKHAGMEEVASLVMNHHERYNGFGYPYRLAAEKIPLGARILAVADSYCAMTDTRVYRRSLTHLQARAEVLRCCGTDFDPRVVDAFLKLID
jgi:putative nucleotidyltransferase with HDIG domain